MKPSEIRAMTVSPGGWGSHGSQSMTRYAKDRPVGAHGKGRRKCNCGCGRWATHTGMANGVALVSGCELSIQRWVRNPNDYRLADITTYRDGEQ